MEKIKFTLPLQEIQKYIAEQKQLDGWLLYDFHGRNSLALDLLGINKDQLLSRRFYYWIPKEGSPLKIVHHIEAHTLHHLPGDQIAYESWQSLDLALKSTLRGCKKIAMEHSPMGELPMLSTLDSGLYQWLMDKKIEITSSWDIAKHYVARLNEEQEKAHKEAVQYLLQIFENSFIKVQKALSSRKKITEYSLQQNILKDFSAHSFVTEHAPVVAVGPNSALPHYSPTEEMDMRIFKDSLLLIDIWCKKNTPQSPFADLTRVAYFGKTPPQEMLRVYKAIKAAEDAAINFIDKTLKKGTPVLGCDVDDVCRAVIQKLGFGKYFVHRTGHNIHTMLHGMGPNLDNYETHDTRPLMPRTCYSIEPGIYIPKAFGMRLECNIIIHDNLSVEVTGRSPDELPCY